MPSLSDLLDNDGFMPHGMCILWRPDLLLLHAISDSLIALAYYSIPIALVYFATKRKDIEFRWMFLLFGTFILACGTTHIFGVWTLWHPDYFADGAVKALTAATSVGTAALLWRVMPLALAIPGKQQLEAMNRDLETQIHIRRQAEASLAELNAELERRVRDRTAEVERANAALKAEIAERVRAERAANENEQRFRNLVESSIMAIVIHRDGKPLFANQAYADMVGCKTPNEVLAIESVARFIVSEEMDRVQGYWAALMRGDRFPSVSESRGRRLDGSIFWVYAQRRLVTWDGEPAVQATLLDVTDRKQAEERLRQAQKMEAIGHLTGGLAHDFNNLIAIVIGNLDLLSESLQDDPPKKALSDMAINAACRGAELTRQLLAFSRQQPLEPQLTNINGLVTDMVSMLSRTLGEDIETILDSGPDLWPVVIDPAQLGSAVANLANNSRDAMPGGGKLRFETRNVTLDADYAAANPDVAPGDYVSLAVSDTGTGMPSDVLAQVFEPFFTTKPEGKGTGLGLSMVFGFIKQSGGHIKIYSEVGSGTIIRIYLPRATETQAPLPAEAQSTDTIAQSRGETVLVVEDNPSVRSLVVMQIEHLGYRVVAADGAAAAIGVLKDGKPIDLLFTDIMMPGGMTGRDLAREATVLKPGLKVLFTSGFLGGGLQDANRLGTRDLFLSKPYRRRDLALKLREALDRD